MTDISQDTNTNGSGNPAPTVQDKTVNDSEIKDPGAILAKNRELLALQKKQKDELATLREQMSQVEQQKMQAEGKKDELISKLQADLKAATIEANKKSAKYAFNVVKKQTELKAKDLGCVDTEALTKIMDMQSLQVDVVDDDFNVNNESLNAQLEKVRKEKPYLFKQAGPTIQDGVPANQNTSNGKTKTFAEMSHDELMKLGRTMSDKK